MNEAQVDTFIADIALEMETLRASERKPVELSTFQEMEIASLPEEQREERRAQYIREANAKKKDEMSLLISAVEDRVKASGLPSKTIKELLNVIGQAKDAGWSFSPDALQKVEEIKEKQNVVEQKNVENKQADVHLENIAVATVAAVAVAEVVEQKKPEKTQEIIDVKPSVSMFKPIAGLFMIDEEMAERNPEKLAKIERIIKRAKKKIDTHGAPLSLEMIEQAQNISPFAKKCLKAEFLRNNPEFTEDLRVQENALQKKDLDVNARKFKHECKVNGNHPDRGKPENAPQYESEEEKFVMEKVVKKIKQSAGTSLTSFEISQKLNEADREVFERYDRRIHPEFYENRDKAADIQDPARNIETRQASDVKTQKIKAILTKQIALLEDGKGAPLSEEEIMNSLHPTLRNYCEQIMVTDPDFLKNRNKEDSSIEEQKQNQRIVAQKTETTTEAQKGSKKPRLRRSLELRSAKRTTKKKQRSGELAKNAALVNKRKKSVA